MQMRLSIHGISPPCLGGLLPDGYREARDTPYPLVPAFEFKNRSAEDNLFHSGPAQLARHGQLPYATKAGLGMISLCAWDE